MNTGTQMRPISITQNLDNTSTTKVAAAQTLGGAGNLVLAAGAAAIDSSGAARTVLFTTTEDDSAVHFTITGLDADGNTITEGPTTLPNSSTKASSKAYASISRIAIDAAIGANISVGTTNSTLTSQSLTQPLDFYDRIAPMVAVEITGTINFTIQETFDPILAPQNGNSVPAGTSGAIWFSPSALATKTSNTAAQLDVGATGVRVQINSYSNGATLTARIISPSNSNLG